jgi:hypothetical protein
VTEIEWDAPDAKLRTRVAIIIFVITFLYLFLYMSLVFSFLWCCVPTNFEFHILPLFIYCQPIPNFCHQKNSALQLAPLENHVSSLDFLMSCIHDYTPTLLFLLQLLSMNLTYCGSLHSMDQQTG